MKQDDPNAWTYGRISREAKRMTGERAGTDGHQAACVIIAGLIVGARARRVAERLGCEMRDIRKYTIALRSSGIWKGDKTDECVTDGLGFNMAVLCALGLLRRTQVSARTATAKDGGA